MVKDRVCQHLSSLGFPYTESRRFASQVQKWINQSGPEWTVERLKELRVTFKEHLESGEYILPPGWATRKNRNGTKIVRDGFVHRILTSPNEGKNFKRKEGFLRTYQVIVLDKCSQKQLSKMVAAVEGDTNADVAKEEECVNTIQIRNISRKDVVKIRAVGSESKSLALMWGNPQKRSPALTEVEYSGQELKLMSTSRQSVHVAKFIDYFAIDNETHAFWKRNPGFVADRIIGKGRPLPVMSYPEYNDVEIPAGTLSVIQEGGAKARWVANPFLAFQALGEPLKDKLWAYTKRAYSHEICTDDQERGYATVTRWISEGRKVWCFDASAFTDRFPLTLQLKVLDQLCEMGIASKSDVESFRLVVQKPWYCSALGRNVKWTVGQPLGYGPSFHLATLTHAALVDSLVPEMVKDDTYCIVGDDIVIADARLAQSYDDVMSDLGVDINRQKTLVSSRYAEFLGKLISVEGVNPSIKTKLLLSPDQVIDTLLFYGPRGLKYLTPQQRSQVMRVYLPVDLGGHDWRLPNVKYEEWLSLTQQDRFGTMRLEADLLNFYGRGLFTEVSEVEKAIENLSEFYSINDYCLSASEWALLGIKERSNDLTNFPVASSRGENLSLPSTNTFRYIVDMITKLAVQDELGNKRRSLTVNTHNYFCSYGYLNQTEKPYNGQSIIEVISNESNSEEKPKRVRKRDVFRKGSIKKQPEENPESISKEKD